ncbi:ribonuclease III [Byssothecium circinans]|uniref:Ribonuclease III n=1 Tax=Byssothecium circinans TaxID=147558 RepID=A0A6A5TW24_9PLEO|nr:ribonuclease III [Byssothecium circinans]
MAAISWHISQAENISGYVFQKKLTCAGAFQAAGQSNILTVDGTPHTVRHNGSLAFLGDAVLDFLLCKIWFEAHGRLGENLGLGPLILQNQAQGEDKRSRKMVATAFEALIGAILIDGGEEAVLKTIKHLGLDKHSNLMVMSTVPPSSP